MFYIKLLSDVLNDASLNLLEKVVKCHIIEIWENQGHVVKDQNNDQGIIRLNIATASRELNISRASYYRCIKKLIELDQLEYKGFKGQFTLAIIKFDYIKKYYDTDKVLKELSNKWKKKENGK